MQGLTTKERASERLLKSDPHAYGCACAVGISEQQIQLSGKQPPTWMSTCMHAELPWHTFDLQDTRVVELLPL